MRFPGQYYDEETGLHYNWHRYYNPATGRYISSDPIGLAGGLNTFGYVGQSPLSGFDSNGLETIIISNINGGYILGMGGQHTGLVVLREGESQESSFLYDLSGSYEIYDKEDKVRMPLDSGRLMQGNEFNPINLDDYLNYQKKDGEDVRVYRFDTTVEEENKILERVIELGGGGAFSCTSNVSATIKGIGPFDAIQETMMPSSLADQLSNLRVRR